MNLLELGRGRGKTTRAIAWLYGGEELSTSRWIPWTRVLAVAGEQRAVHIRRQMARLDPDLVDSEYHLYRSPILRAVISAGPKWASWIAPDSEVAIDELDDVLAMLIGRPVSWATMTPREDT